MYNLAGALTVSTDNALQLALNCWHGVGVEWTIEAVQMRELQAPGFL